MDKLAPTPPLRRIAWNKGLKGRQVAWNKGLKGVQIAWNKGIKIDRNKYPKFGHFQKHTKEALRKITIANKIHAKEKPKEFWIKTQKLSIISGLKNHSYKGTLGKIKELSAVWLGDKATYNTKHRWIQKHWIKTGVCQNCRISPKPYGRRKWGTEWHNLDGKYDRENKNSWIELCSKCHKNMDTTREHDLNMLRRDYKQSSDPNQRRQIEIAAEKIRKESGAVRSMREALVREHRKGNKGNIADIHSIVEHESKYQ
jgi:hypothetical protein